MSEEIKKKMLMVSAILYKSNVPVEEAKIIGHFIEELQQENQQLKEQLEKKYKKVGTLTNEILYEENTKLLSLLDEIKEQLKVERKFALSLNKPYTVSVIDKLLDKVKE